MIKIGIAGISGRMGREVLEAVIQDEDCELAGAYVLEDNKFIGKDVNILLNTKKTGIKITSDIKEFCKNIDVIIEFTAPENNLDLFKVAAKYAIPIVSGTTNMPQSHFKEINKLSKKIPIFWSPNTSPTVNLIARILNLITHELDESFDIEIIDTHHRDKLDSPSGTALKFGQVIANAKKISFENNAILDRQIKKLKRQNNHIGFSSIRAGSYCGEHKIIFANKNEIIEIRHSALNRKIFAEGAIKATKWIYKKTPGLYSMQDIT